jgi:hypothetical protein
MTPLNGTAFQYRTKTGGTTAPVETGNPAQVPPHWLRLVRAGSVVTGYISTDGVNWTQRGTVTLTNLPATVYIGFAVVSRNDGVLSTAVFDNVAK